MDDFDDFDYDGIVSQSVLDFELEAARAAQNEDLVEKLEMAGMLMETSVASGQLTPEAYEARLRKKLEEMRGEAEKGGKYEGKVKQHIRLMDEELAQMLAAAAPSLRSMRSLRTGLSMRSIPANPPDLQPSLPRAPAPATQHEQLLLANSMYRYCYAQLMETKFAFEYMRGFGLVERLEAVIQKAELYQRVVNEFRAGRPPSIPLLSFTPKDIFGLLESQRQQRISELTAALTKLASHYKSKALDSIRNNDKEEAALLKRRMLNYEAHVEKMEALRVNPWQPLPKVSAETVIDRVKMINEDVPEDVLRVKVGEVSGLAETESVFLVGTIALQGGETKFKTGLQKTKKVAFVHDIKLIPAQMQGLESRRINIELFNAQSESLGTHAFKPSDLESHCTSALTLPLTRRGTPTVKFTLQLHKALKVIEYSSVQSQQLVIVAFLPPFKNLDGSIYQPQLAVNSSPEEGKSAAIAGSQGAKSSGNAGVRDAPPPIVPEGLSQEELKDPNVIHNLNSVEVLETENKKLMEMIPRLRADGKDVSRLIEQQRAVARKFITLQQQAENGLVSPQLYKSVLLQSVAHDQLLLKALQDSKQSDKAQIVAKRIATMQRELGEMEQI